MASNPHFTATARNAFLDAITSGVGASGLLRIYDGTQPTNVATALGAQVKLAELACSATFAPGASGGVLTINAITTDASADATGTATWATFTTSGGTRIVDMSVGTSAADFILNSVAITVGAAVACSAATVTFPA